MAEQSPTPHDSTPASTDTRGRIFDRRSLPAGVVPRHLQQWVLIGTAVVMVGILAVSSPTTPSKPAGATPAAASATDPNQKRIEEYQRRIQEQADRLAAEAAQLQRTKDALSSPLVGDQAAPAAEEPGASSPRPTTARSFEMDDDQPAAVESVSSGRDRRDLRDDRGPVADNIAFTRPDRTEPPSDHSPLAADPSASVGAIDPPAPTSLTNPTSRSLPAGPASQPSPGSPVISTSPTRPTSPTTPTSATRPEEPRYRVYEGTVIETVLTNRLDGTFSGPVNCLVSVPVYASDHVVIPAGARVLGDAHAVNTFGQSRLAVTFHRVILPNGVHIDLDAFHGLNQIGDLGLRDQVDRHYGQIFGVSIALGAIAGFAHGQSAVGVDASGLDAYRQGAAASVAQSSTRVLDRFLNILPTVTIREGHRIKVYLSNDLELPAYRPALAGNGGRR